MVTPEYDVLEAEAVGVPRNNPPSINVPTKRTLAKREMRVHSRGQTELDGINEPHFQITR